MKSIFFSGLTAIIPVVLTIYVIVGLFQFADGILGHHINRYLESYLDYSIPGIGIILSLLIILFLGVLIRLSRNRLRKFMESLFLRIPLVNKIYFPIRQIVDFLFFQPTRTFRKVVLIEYPRHGIYTIGFITSDANGAFENKVQKKLFNVFVPSSPSPLTGFMIVIPQEDVIILDISVEEAIRLIISGGMLNPHNLS
ncbi:MAG: DUF502 domain-containing protein [Candidatus Omnitrophica bacterium]|nr:DUF502 domain-containing protein [Candidatus Omnitrophota bacterium]